MLDRSRTEADIHEYPQADDMGLLRLEMEYSRQHRELKLARRVQVLGTIAAFRYQP